MTMELRHIDLEERYRTRTLYAQPEDEGQCRDELAEVQEVWLSWVRMADEADNVDWTLEDTKALFSETTRTQVRGGGGRRGGTCT